MNKRQRKKHQKKFVSMLDGLSMIWKNPEFEMHFEVGKTPNLIITAQIGPDCERPMNIEIIPKYINFA